MRALITGITGFVGSHLADLLLTKNVEVIGLTRWRSPKENIRHLVNEVILEHGDLLDFSSLHRILNKHRPDIVFHLAAQSYVPYSFDVPAATLDVNVIGTCNLLEAIRVIRKEHVQPGTGGTGVPVPRFDPIIHVCSSSECYGQVQENETPITENNPLRPASPYAVSKVAEDMLAFQYYISWGMKIIRTRLFSHTGPRRGDVFVVSNFAKQIAEIEKDLRPPVISVGNLDSIRTFMDVRDAVKAYWLLVNICSAGEVYNVGGNATMSIKEMLDKLLALSFKSIEVKIDPDRLRPSDVTLQIPSTDKFRATTGWQPEIDFDTTLKDTLEYWRACE